MQSDVLKITLLGDGNVGKTCFLYRLVLAEFPTDYVPTSFPGETYGTSYLLDGNTYTLQFIEPVGGEDFHRLRPLAYPGTDLFVIFYDIAQRKSFDDVSSYYEEIRHHMPCTPILLLGNKMDLRDNAEEQGSASFVSLHEARDLAGTMDIMCVECSALSGQGVLDTTFVMLYMAVYGQKPQVKSFFKRKKSKRQQVEGLILGPKEAFGMENAPQCPGVNVLPSRSVEDFGGMICDTTCTDVRFTFKDNTKPVDAHQVILISAAPDLFQEILIGSAREEVSGLPQKLFEKVSWPSHVGQSDTSTAVSRIVEIRVCDKVNRKEFVKLLEFLYSGASLTYLKSEDSIQELMAIAKAFNLCDLLGACENVLEGNERENIRRTSFVGGGMATMLRTFFLNNPLLEDIVFQVQGNLLYAHQPVIVARSHVLRAMVTDYCRDHPECIRVKIVIEDISCETFKCLMEYLYTDNVSSDIEQEVVLDLLSLANRYDLPRLVTLCEYQLIVKVQELSDRVGVAVNYTVDIFLEAKKQGAQQLVKWSLNLIARNYDRFKSSKNIERLSEEDQEYVEQNQWPQKCYLSDEKRAVLDQCLVSLRANFSAESKAPCNMI